MVLDLQNYFGKVIKQALVHAQQTLLVGSCPQFWLSFRLSWQVFTCVVLHKTMNHMYPLVSCYCPSLSLECLHPMVAIICVSNISVDILKMYVSCCQMEI